MIEPAELRVDGAGPHTVVLLHGWPDSLQLWDGQVQALAPRYRCVRLTLPGFRGPRLDRIPSLDELVDMLARVIDRESGGAPVTLLLHDWGCVFGYEYAMRHPQRVKRVIGTDIGDAGSRAHVASLNLGQKLGMVGYQAWLARAWHIGRRWPSLADRMTRGLAKAMKVPADPATLHAGLNYPYALMAAGGLKGLHPVALPCPMLFLYGRNKPFMFHSPAWVEQLSQRPGCAAHGLDAGHWLMLSRRDEFNRLLLDWLSAGA